MHCALFSVQCALVAIFHNWLTCFEQFPDQSLERFLMMALFKILLRFCIQNLLAACILYDIYAFSESGLSLNREKKYIHKQQFIQTDSIYCIEKYFNFIQIGWPMPILNQSNNEDAGPVNNLYSSFGSFIYIWIWPLEWIICKRLICISMVSSINGYDWFSINCNENGFLNINQFMKQNNKNYDNNNKNQKKFDAQASQIEKIEIKIKRKRKKPTDDFG